MNVQDVWEFMLIDSYGDLKPLNQQHLPFFSEWGSYPIIYLTKDNEVLCADCATKALYLLDDEFYPPIAYGVYWEGAPYYCADCNREIESAYGDPDDNDGRDPTNNDDNENYRPSGMG